MECSLTRLLAVLLTVLFAAGQDCAAQRLTEAVSQSGRDVSKLTLLPGDVLRIDVWQQKEYSCECAIGADGTISHPLYRELNVSGLGITEIENRLRTLLGRYLST